MPTTGSTESLKEKRQCSITFVLDSFYLTVTLTNMSVISHSLLPNSAQSSMNFCCGFGLVPEAAPGLRNISAALPPSCSAPHAPERSSAAPHTTFCPEQDTGVAACRSPQQHSTPFFSWKKMTESRDGNLIYIRNMN